jgi:metallo-beta-lactamase class B
MLPIAFVVLLFAAGSVMAHGAGGAQAGPRGETQSADAQRAAWNRPVEPHGIAGNIHFVGVEGLGAYLITTPAGHILIDGGLEESAPLIERNIRALGFRLEDVKWLLISHAHFDHAGGLASLKAKSGAQLVSMEAERAALESGRHVGDNENGVGRFPAVQVDRVIKDGETVSLGGSVLTAHHTPGHTPGCTTWTLPVQVAEARHTALFYCSTTVAGNALVGNRGHPTIVADYRRSFGKLKRMQADIFLANHPSFAKLADKRARMNGGGANPFIDASELARFVLASERDFDMELARQQTAAKVF